MYDGVVDTTGGKILAKALSHTRPNGIVAACGLASSYKLETTVMPFIIRGVKLWGMNSVTAPAKEENFYGHKQLLILILISYPKVSKNGGLEDLVQNSSEILKAKFQEELL